MGAAPELTTTLSTGTRLTLRPWKLAESDVATVQAAARDHNIRRFSSVGLVRTRTDAAAWLSRLITSPNRIDWAVDSDGITIGRVGLARINYDDGDAEFAYWLFPPARGRGVASASVLTVTQWAFTSAGLGRLDIRHEPGNAPSCALATRCGFPAEGLQRGAFTRAGRRYDLYVHARLVTDPPPA